jgi:hypothetical protein
VQWIRVQYVGSAELVGEFWVLILASFDDGSTVDGIGGLPGDCFLQLLVAKEKSFTSVSKTIFSVSQNRQGAVESEAPRSITSLVELQCNRNRFNVYRLKAESQISEL